MPNDPNYPNPRTTPTQPGEGAQEVRRNLEKTRGADSNPTDDARRVHEQGKPGARKRGG